MDIDYRINPTINNADLDELYLQSWPNHQPPYDFTPELKHSLVYICACIDDRVIGFVRLAWDGGIHAFLLEPTVHPEFRRRGIGTELVQRVVSVARDRGMQWVHVDYEPDLHAFYEACGFTPTSAGLIRLVLQSDH